MPQPSPAAPTMPSQCFTSKTPGTDKCTAHLTNEDATNAPVAIRILIKVKSPASPPPSTLTHPIMTSRNAPSVAELVAQAGNYTYNGHIPLANWLRTANTMQKEVRHATPVLR